MNTIYSIDGNKILVHYNPGKPWEETALFATCDEPEKALTLMKKAWGLNESRKYTAAARLLAQAEALQGFAWAHDEHREE